MVRITRLNEFRVVCSEISGTNKLVARIHWYPRIVGTAYGQNRTIDTPKSR